jgi:hypothetical protein
LHDSFHGDGSAFHRISRPAQFGSNALAIL